MLSLTNDFNKLKDHSKKIEEDKQKLKEDKTQYKQKLKDILSQIIDKI